MTRLIYHPSFFDKLYTAGYHSGIIMTVFTHQDFDQHEQVLFYNDPSVGLQAIIAIHSTALGPAAGGCRMHPYATVDDALTDVLRLSKGMSYKSSVAGLPLGGGKCVIIADPSRAVKPQRLRDDYTRSCGRRWNGAATLPMGFASRCQGYWNGW